jgi:hypothetical protein
VLWREGLSAGVLNIADVQFVGIARQSDYRELSSLRRLLWTGTRHDKNKGSCCCCIVRSIGYDMAKPNEAKKGVAVTSASRGVIRPPSVDYSELGTNNAYFVMFPWR